MGRMEAAPLVMGAGEGLVGWQEAAGGGGAAAEGVKWAEGLVATRVATGIDSVRRAAAQNSASFHTAAARKSVWGRRGLPLRHVRPADQPQEQLHR